MRDYSSRREYISREKLDDFFDEHIRGYENCPDKYDATIELKASSHTIPAADVAPVVRGKWNNYGDEYRPDIQCCICGQRKPILLGNFNFNYCPNCGAKMDGGAE